MSTTNKFVPGTAADKIVLGYENTLATDMYFAERASNDAYARVQAEHAYAQRLSGMTLSGALALGLVESVVASMSGATALPGTKNRTYRVGALVDAITFPALRTTYPMALSISGPTTSRTYEPVEYQIDGTTGIIRIERKERIDDAAVLTVSAYRYVGRRVADTVGLYEGRPPLVAMADLTLDATDTTTPVLSGYRALVQAGQRVTLLSTKRVPVVTTVTVQVREDDPGASWVDAGTVAVDATDSNLPDEIALSTLGAGVDTTSTRITVRPREVLAGDPTAVRVRVTLTNAAGTVAPLDERTLTLADVGPPSTPASLALTVAGGVCTLTYAAPTPDTNATGAAVTVNLVEITYERSPDEGLVPVAMRDATGPTTATFTPAGNAVTLPYRDDHTMHVTAVRFRNSLGLWGGTAAAALAQLMPLRTEADVVPSGATVPVVADANPYADPATTAQDGTTVTIPGTFTVPSYGPVPVLSAAGIPAVSAEVSYTGPTSAAAVDVAGSGLRLTAAVGRGNDTAAEHWTYVDISNVLFTVTDWTALPSTGTAITFALGDDQASTVTLYKSDLASPGSGPVLTASSASVTSAATTITGRAIHGLDAALEVIVGASNLNGTTVRLAAGQTQWQIGDTTVPRTAIAATASYTDTAHTVGDFAGGAQYGSSVSIPIAARNIHATTSTTIALSVEFDQASIDRWAALSSGAWRTAGAGAALDDMGTAAAWASTTLSLTNGSGDIVSAWNEDVDARLYHGYLEAHATEDRFVWIRRTVAGPRALARVDISFVGASGSWPALTAVADANAAVHDDSFAIWVRYTAAGEDDPTAWWNATVVDPDAATITADQPHGFRARYHGYPPSTTYTGHVQAVMPAAYSGVNVTVDAVLVLRGGSGLSLTDIAISNA